MRSARTVVLSVLGLFVFAGVFATTASGQSISTASKGAELSVFGGYMPTQTDYGYRTYKGYSAGADFTIFPRFFLAPSIEVRGNIAQNQPVTEKTVLGGIRLQREIGRLHPYGDFLLGGGELLFHPAPSPDYTGDRSRVFSYGGGVNIDVTRHFAAKFDFQQQSWNLGSNAGNTTQGTFTLSPRTFMAGVTYTIPFRKLNRQGDFR
jgi:hypothetical protein